MNSHTTDQTTDQTDQTDQTAPGMPAPAPTTSTSSPGSATTGSVTRLVELANGQYLAFEDFGDPGADAPVVLFLHSSPGSRLFDPDPAATAAAGVRLLTVDRPGYGASTPWPASTLPNIVDGAEWIAEGLAQLGIDRVGVVGWSAGGRTALALAALHPELVRRVAVVGTPAPDDEVAWLSDEHRSLASMMRADPTTAMASIVGVFRGPEPDQGAPSDEVMLSMVAGGPGDDDVLSHTASRAAVTRMLHEGFARGPEGVAADIVADCVAPWAFDLSDVAAPVTAFYSDQDTIVGPEHGTWYAEQVQDGTERSVAGVGHLLVITEWADILESVVEPRS